MSRFTDPDENEISQYLRKALAGQAGQNPKDQALARSSNNPRAQRAGLQNMDARNRENLRNEADAAREQERAMKEQQAAQEATAKEQAAMAEDQRKRSVREAAAAGVKVATDVESGKRDIVRHADGAPVWEAGPQGDPVIVGQSRTAIKDETTGQVTPVPDTSIMMGGGGDSGAISADGTTTQAVWKQQVRDDRGDSSYVDPESKTDAKTGAITYDKTNPTTGQKETVMMGRDLVAQEKAQRQAVIDEAENSLTLEEVQTKGARMRFDPAFQPVDKELKEAQADADKLPPAPQLKGSAWVRVSADTGKETFLSPEEIAFDKKKREDVQKRLKAAKAAHDPLAQQNKLIADKERELDLRKQEIAEERAGLTAGLPKGYNHLQAALAKEMALSPATDGDVAAEEIGAASVPAPDVDPTPAPVPLTDLSASGKRAFGGMADLPGVSGEAWAAGTQTAFYRGNQRVAIMRPVDGAQALFLNDENPVAKNDWDIVKAQASKPGSMPLYVRDNPNRVSAQAESRWVADSVNTLQQLAGDESAPLTQDQKGKLITDLGLQPDVIKRKVFDGEISVNTGQKLLKDLYNDTLEVTDPNDETAFQSWISADPKRTAKWKEATEGVGYSFSKQNTIKQDYLSEWYALNKGKPGIRRADVLAMHSQDVGDKQGVLSGANIASKAGAVGRSVRDDVAGSMVGLALGAVSTLGAAEAALFGVDGAKKELDEGMRLRNRDFASWANSSARNIKAWTTPAGMKAKGTFDIAAGSLQKAIDEAEDHPGDSVYQDLVTKAEERVRASALAMHELARDEDWPVTADNLDPNKDSSLGRSLALYKATADPRMFELYKERLLQGNGRRQYSEELEKKIGPQEGGFWGSVNHAMYAGWQELGSELVADAAALATGGAAKALQISARTGRGIAIAADAAKLGKAARVGRAIDAGMEALVDFSRIGESVGTLQKPLTKMQKAANTGLTVAKGAVGEGFEEVLVEVGAEDPNLVQAFGMGMLGAFGLAPAQIAGAAMAREGVSDVSEQKRNATLAENYNKRMAGTAGFVPIDADAAGLARTMITPESQAKAAELRKIIANPTASSPALQAIQKAKAQQMLTDIAVQDEITVAAAREIMQVTDPAQRAFISGIAKVASGNTALLTRNELKAVSGAKTASGADYFAQVAMPNGRMVETITAEGRADMMDNHPSVGALIQTDESSLLLQAQAEQQSTAAQQGTAAPAVQAPVAQGQNPASQGQSAPVQGQTTVQPAQAKAPNVALAGMDLALYESARASDPDMASPHAVVAAARAAGAPVSPSMADYVDNTPDPDAVAVSPPVEELAAMEHSAFEAARATNAAIPSAQEVVAAARAAGIPISDSMAQQVPEVEESTPYRPDTTPEQIAAAEQIAARIIERVAVLPGVKDRIRVNSDPNAIDYNGGLFVYDGIAYLSIPDIAVRLRSMSEAAVSRELLIMLMRHELMHIAQQDYVNNQRKQGESFSGAWKRIYGKDGMWGELQKNPLILKMLKEVYDEKSATKDGSSAWNQINGDENKAAEGVRILLEIFTDPKRSKQKARVSELLRAQNNNNSDIAKFLKEVIDKLTEWVNAITGDAAFSAVVTEHLQGVSELYRELTSETAAAKGQENSQSAPQLAANQATPSPATGSQSDIPAANSGGMSIIRDGANSRILDAQGEEVANGTEAAMEAEWQSMQAAMTNPALVAGAALKAAYEKFPKLAGKNELADVAGDLIEQLENVAPEERAAFAEKALNDLVNALADRVAQDTGKDRMEVIEGFRTVAGKRQAAAAASVEAAIVGNSAPIIPAGPTEKRDTPNSEMTIEVTQTALDLDQLVGSSDPRFPGAALQPRNRAGQASANQREEMVQNIRDKDGQYKRYVEGSTTDSGRLVVAPLFGADGAHMTNENGKPLFYVISGNGRRNALEEARNRKVDSRYQREVREALSNDNTDVSAMAMPVPVSIYVPETPKQAIDLAEFSNRDAQLSVSNTEQANRDAASIEKDNLLRLWEPDQQGNAGAASNRDFVKAFSRAIGDEGILDSKGNLTDEGEQRIERAMVAMLLGPKESQLTEMLFNRSGALGLRGILSGIATEAGNLLKLAAEKPDFDLTPVLADALRTAVEAKAAVNSGTFASVAEFFDQGDMFNPTENTPERQLARALVESRTSKAIREILTSYRKGAEAVDVSTMSMFASEETTREDLILRALEARPIEQVIAELETEFGKTADLPAKLRVVAAGVKKLDAALRRDFMAAVGAEAQRLRDGVISATEWQRLNPGELTPKAAMFQRIIDSHNEKTFPDGFRQLLTKDAKAVLASSPTPQGGLSFSEEKAALLKVAPRGSDGQPLAPNGQRSELTEDQWATVRTKGFKNWFGDWDSLWVQNQIAEMASVNVKIPDEWRGKSPSEMRELMAQKLDAMVKSNAVISHPLLGEVKIGRRGANKTVATSSDPAKMLVTADIESIFPQSILAGFQPSNEQGVDGYSKLLIPIQLDAVELVAIFTIRHQSDGSWYYNSVTVEGEKMRPGSYASSGALARPLEQTPITGLKEFLRQPLSVVNSESVSKVVDENGEPQASEIGKFTMNQNPVLGSSPTQPDLFSDLEAKATGPRAKAKANAFAQAKAAPAKGREILAKRVAKLEGLADLDLFATAAVKSLDAQPRANADLFTTKFDDSTKPEKVDNGKGLSDFGENLNVRKNRPSTFNADISDSDMTSQPFAKLWPKADVDSIESIPAAAIAHSLRESIPAKPRTDYKLRRWAEKLRSARAMMKMVETEGADYVLAQMGKLNSSLAAKARILMTVPRAQWSRIESVGNYPDAYMYEKDPDGGQSKMIPSPFADAVVDGSRIRATNITELAEKLQAMFAENSEAKAPGKPLKFEVRFDRKTYYINKKGDPLYSRLGEFETSKEAFAYIRNNYPALVAAWEGVKDRMNVKKTDVRNEENRPRVGQDWRNGKNATAEMFQEAFGFRGVAFGKWVDQGGNVKERQGMLNLAYDSLMDLAKILGVPSRAMSLDGSLGLAFGADGSGQASATYNEGDVFINLTKTRGAGTLAHEFFHALDNYFQKKRPGKSRVPHGGNFMTYQPEAYYQHQKTGDRLSITRFNQIKQGGRFDNLDDWKRIEGVRPEVEERFAELVKTINASPMSKRAAAVDKGKEGYWSRIIEKAARSFENYVIHSMMKEGYQNDYLANVKAASAFVRDAGLYPYLLPEEIAPVAEAFDNLFSAMETRETDRGVMLMSSPSPATSVESAVVTPPADSITTVEEFRDAMMAPFTEEVIRAEQPKASYSDKRQLLFNFAASITDPAGEVPAKGAPGMLGDIPIIRQRLAREIAVNLKVEFLGDIVDTPEALAAKAQALRNPMFETFYVLAAKKTRKGVKIVDAMAITSRNPGSANIFADGKNWDEGIADHLEFLKNAKADSYFLLHNHPSGDPSPSRADLIITKKHAESMAENGITLADHIVINHKTFARINAYGEHEINSISKSAATSENWPSAMMEHEIYGPLNLVEAAIQHQAQRGDSSNILGFFTNPKLKINASFTATIDELLKLTPEKVADYARTQGATSLFLHAVAKNEIAAGELLSKLKPLNAAQILRDVVVQYKAADGKMKHATGIDNLNYQSVGGFFGFEKSATGTRVQEEVIGDQVQFAAFGVDSTKSFGDVRVGRMDALKAYRTLTTKKAKLGTLTAKEEQQLLDAETALGQKMAFDMDAVKAPSAQDAPTGLFAPRIGDAESPVQQMEMSRTGEMDRSGQMVLLSSPSRTAPVDIPDAIVAHALGAATSRPEYEAAKAGDPAAALQLSRALVTDDVVQSIRNLIGDKKPIIVPVLAIEQTGNNMIPLASANVLASKIKCEITEEITQSVKANRSKLSGLDRVFQRAAFDGEVISGADYLLVDDTLTQGGTFAALAEHIRSNGGNVIGVFALTGRQYSAKLRLSNELLGALREKYGDVEQDFVRATGYGFDYLTESEARALASFRPADAVRNRIVTSGNEAGQRVDEKGAGDTLKSSPSSDALRVSPTPPAARISELMAKVPPIYRAVYADLQAGLSPQEVATKNSIPVKGVANIMRRLESYLGSVTLAAADVLQPVTDGNGLIAGGRPDLSLSGNPMVAAVDQLRDAAGIPEVRSQDSVNEAAAAMLAKDYQGAYDALLNRARDGGQMTDTEVAATKMIISKETMSGKIESAEDRMKLAMLIHGYREIGTETARSLAMRRDPHQSPAERHAQYIAEALFTPDPETRRKMRKNPKSAEAMLQHWMKRVDGINRQLLMQGIDLKASLAAYNQEKIEQQEAENTNKQTADVIKKEINKLNKFDKAIIQAIMKGGKDTRITKIAFLFGTPAAQVRELYLRFQGNLRESMKSAAKEYMASALRVAPSRDVMDDIMAELGLPSIDEIDDTAPDFEKRRETIQKERRKRKTPRRKTPAPATVPTPADPNAPTQSPTPAPSPKPKPPIDERTGTWEDKGDFEGQGEFFDKPLDGQTGTWEEERDFMGQTVVIRGDLDEMRGVIDLNDPIAIKAVMDAFALARGSKMDALMEFWRMSILTGPQTHVVNVGSNLLNAAYQMIPKRGAEAVINNLLGVVGLGSKDKATLGEFIPMMRNLKTGAALAARNALRSWKLEARTFEAYATAQPIQLDFTGVGSEYIPPALGGKFGKVMRSLSFRAMTAADEFMKSMYGQMEAAAQAHRIASNEKLTGDAYAKRLDQLMVPGSEAWVRAVSESKRITFQEDMDASNPRLIHRIDQLADLAKDARRMPYLGKPLTFFLPFIDTPTNIFKQAVLMSPMGTFISLVDGARALRRRVFSGDISKEEAKSRASELYDRARFVEDLTNQTIGWMIFFAIESLVGGEDDDELPYITGTVPYKTTARGERDNTYAVMPAQTIRIGGAQFSYSRIEPFATVLASMVDFSQSIKRNGYSSKATSEWLSRFKDAAKDKTFLQGISNLFNAIEDPDRFAERLGANIVTGFVPNIVRQPIRELDSNQRDTNPMADAGFWESVAVRVGYGIVPQAAPVKMDVWGNEVPSNRGEITGIDGIDMAARIFDPTNMQFNAPVDEIDKWIFKWNRQTADPKDRISIMAIDDAIQGTVPGENRPRNFALTPEERAKVNREAGQAARAMLGEGWDKMPRTPENAQRIIDVVRQSQSYFREALRNQKISELMK